MTDMIVVPLGVGVVAVGPLIMVKEEEEAGYAIVAKAKDVVEAGSATVA
jgi:hypothetical protein